jgi:hypothetical protein
MVGNEYSTGMMHTTLTAMPRRLTVLCSKSAVLIFGEPSFAAAGLLWARRRVSLAEEIPRP